MNSVLREFVSEVFRASSKAPDGRFLGKCTSSEPWKSSGSKWFYTGRPRPNGITVVPQLLDLPDLHGCIVIIDATGCQRKIAQQITDGGADCMLGLKENQGQLHVGI